MTSHPEDSSAPPTAAVGRSFRWLPAVVIVIVSMLTAVAVDTWVEDQTFVVIVMLYVIIFTLLALLLWWLFFSGLTWMTRISGVVAGTLLVIIGYRLTVAAITFDGAMQPKIRWVWEPSASDVASEWLEQHAPERTVADAEDIRIVVRDDDWAQYCGTGGNRTIHEPLAQLDWDSNPPRELWRHPVGAAWSSFSVVGNRLYTQEQRDTQECVVCYDSTTGEELWRREDTARYETAMGGTGPRATPTVTDNSVFALGATGILNCLNPVTGELIWQRNICDDAGSEVLEWGMSGSPFIHRDTVIVDAGGYSNRAVIAYDRSSGEIAWAAENHQAGYATPRIETVGGVDQLLIFHGDGLLAVDPDDGTRFWEYPWTNMYKINVAQPIRTGNRIFLSSGYDAGCVLLDPTQLTNGVPAEVWPPNNHLKLKFNEAVEYNGYVYGLDDGILCCIDLQTGERQWKGGRYRFGQVLLWEDKLIVSAEKGYVAVVQATPTAHRELSRLQVLSDRTWNMHVVNRGRLYIRNAYEAACFELQPASDGTADSANEQQP